MGACVEMMASVVVLYAVTVYVAAFCSGHCAVDITVALPLMRGRLRL